MTRDEALDNVGATVVYTPTYNGARPEVGVITRVTDTYVFVQYRGDQHSKATSASFLRLAGESR